MQRAFFFFNNLSQYADIGLVYNLPSCFVYLLFFPNRIVVIAWIFWYVSFKGGGFSVTSARRNAFHFPTHLSHK